MIDGFTFVRDIEVKCKNSGTIDFYYTTANCKNQKLEEILKNLFVFDGTLHCYVDNNEDKVKKITLMGIGKKVRIFDIKENSLSSYSNEFVFENIFFICQNSFDVNNLFDLFSFGTKDYKINLICDLLFKKCTFTINDKSRICNITFKKISFQDCRFMEDIHFQYCTFADTFILENSLIHSFSLKRKHVYFSNCSYYVIPNIKGIKNRINHIDLSSGDFNTSVNFDDSEILDHKIKVSFTGSEFHENVIFNNEPMRNIVYRNQIVKTRLFRSEIDFTSVKFHQNIDLTSVVFFNKIDFRCSQFFENFYFGKYNFHKSIEEEIYFWECKFYKTFDMSNKDGLDVKMSFCETEFFGVARFDRSKFNKSLSMHGSIFHKEVCFDESKFREVVSFSDVTFNENVSLMQTKFFKDVQFDKAKVYKSIDFYNALFGSNISFKSTEFKSFINFNNVKFKHIPILGAALIHPNTLINIAYVDIEKTEIKEIDNSLNIYDEKLDFLPKFMAFELCRDKLLTLTNIMETCRIFKDILLKENNIINATAYKKIELYINELEYFYKDNPKLNSFDDIETDNISSLKLRDKIDWWFLKLNRTTSDHHTDFLKIFLFTLSVIGGYFMINFGLSFDEKIISSIYSFVDLGLAMYGISVVIFLLCLGYEFLFVLKGFSKDKGWLIFIFLAICLLGLRLAYSFNVSEFSVFLPMIFIGILAMIFILLANNIKYTFISFATAGFIGILCNPSIITPFLGAFSEDARNHYLYKVIDELDSQKALDLSKQILAKEPTSELNAKKTLKDYKNELKSSDLLDKAPELKRAVAIDGGVSRLNIAYYLVLAFCIFALQKTMRKNSIIPS